MNDKTEHKIGPHDPDRCQVRCDKGSQCVYLAGHGGGHETEHGCICYDDSPRPITTMDAIDWATSFRARQGEPHRPYDLSMVHAAIEHGRKLGRNGGNE